MLDRVYDLCERRNWLTPGCLGVTLIMAKQSAGRSPVRVLRQGAGSTSAASRRNPAASAAPICSAEACTLPT